MLTNILKRHKVVLGSLFSSGLLLMPAIDTFFTSEFVLAWLLWFLFFYLIFRVHVPPETHQIIAALAILPVSFLAPFLGASGEAGMFPLYFSVAFCILISGVSFHAVWRSITHS